jgi:MoxR-like ATPase
MFPLQQYIEKIIQNVEQVIVGKRSTIELLMVALLSEGHILLEDVPGTGKTMLARSIAISLGGSFKRLQCTPDLLPNDVTGVSIFNQQRGDFEFRPGPIFVNILLADEINRATPRTQSALLEAMQEQQVTVDGITRPLSRPFMVLATQNPIEYEGTFPLPEAQLDRFLMRLALGYPQPADERQILLNLKHEHPINHLQQLEFFTRSDKNEPPDRIDGLAALLQYQQQVWDIHVDDSLQDYIVQLVGATRSHPDLALGASPRASFALFRSSQALAAIRGRDYVVPDDLKLLAPVILPHRLIVHPEAELRGKSNKVILEEILADTTLELGGITE